MAPTTLDKSMAFDLATRTIIAPIGQDTRSSGGVTTQRIANTGFLAHLWLTIRGTINVVTGAPNAFGQSAIIARVRVQTSGSVDLINITGPSYFHLLLPIIDQPINAISYTTGRTVIASAGAVKLDMYLPIELNMIDQIGYFSMQNNKQFATIIINWETDAALAATSITWTLQPALFIYQEWRTVPVDAQGNALTPKQGTLHSLRDWSTAYAAAGEQRQPIPIASSYVQLAYGCGAAAAGADSWSRFKIQANHHETIWEATPELMDLNHSMLRGLVRALGYIPIDLYGLTGRGVYGSARDTINSQPLTDLDALITNTIAITVWTLAREVIPVPARATAG